MKRPVVTPHLQRASARSRAKPHVLAMTELFHGPQVLDRGVRFSIWAPPHDALAVRLCGKVHAPGDDSRFEFRVCDHSSRKHKCRS